ncbi:MAG: ImmA/IrrE family metallo-endopeptidase [Acidimicrobiaceae bacterium]|nr:ImmA/IrrE family metallo-endopeptidase [Acidimicrobiaceae bacterium]MYE75815.1 ImmA/IrrE family metallo-endopeptidase [Acidimicrobiaceae bacterium]MYJ42017.1 ImmA/IrrE family metallo-endopeptidase [Acidimicrobiaceae bacterium]MYJ81991.1 ImmA/IrrE family metallo-endopeptidase [Acidimicrobiaceae bacterium]
MTVGPGDLGGSIAAARRDAGLTQDECAARAGLHRSALAKIETGARRVEAMELARLADALEMRIEWFFDEAPASVVSRRSAADPGEPSPRIDRVVERVARETMFLQSVGVGLELPETPGLAVPGTPEEAEAAAAQVRRLLGYDESEPALRLTDRAAAIGLLAFSLELGEHGADGASILLAAGGVAVVNGSRPLGRRRLTLAHELGHYVFADEYSTDWNVADSDAARDESLMDRFARAVLLPEHALRDRWRSDEPIRTPAVLVASEYRVDMSTLARRLTELELAPSSQADEIRASRTRRADIVEHALVVPTDLAPPDLPSAYVKAVLEAYTSEEVTAARALDLLLGTWNEDDLPELPLLPAEAVWSFVS